MPPAISLGPSDPLRRHPINAVGDVLLVVTTNVQAFRMLLKNAFTISKAYKTNEP